MKKLLLILLMLPAAAVFGQSGKAINKAIDTYNKAMSNNDFDGMTKGIEMMAKAMNDPAENTQDNWDKYVKMVKIRYLYVADNYAGQKLNDKDGNPVLVSDVFLSDYLSVCKAATLQAHTIDADITLRNYLVDYYPDSLVSKDAKDLLDKAGTYSDNGDNDVALIYYHKALAADTNYYRARMMIGRIEYFLKDYDSAIYYLQQSIAIHPDLLEPRKYLSDVYMDMRNNDSAEATCFEAIGIYPDISMLNRLSTLMVRDAKELDMHWISRGYSINSFKYDQDPIDDPLWSVYREAKNDVKNYCNEDGIIAENPVTKEKYLEVYSWEKMLKNARNLPDYMQFAKKMMDEGYLDCYVFISLFHVDDYSQFKDWAASNQSRIREYIEKYCTD